MLSTDHIPLMLSSTQMLYNIYIIYIIVQSLSHFRSKCFLKKFIK
jgi:hypothetical protein